MTARPLHTTVLSPAPSSYRAWESEAPTSPLPLIGALPAAAPYGTGPFAGSSGPDPAPARHRQQAAALAVTVALTLFAALLIVVGVL